MRYCRQRKRIEERQVSVQIDYTTIAVISVCSGFGGALGAEIGKGIIGMFKSKRVKKALKRVNDILD
jgi:hypothetical protein